jgi:hypothetical protein
MERNKLVRLEESKKLKDMSLLTESKKIRKKENEARKLEMMEAEILQRLKDTHVK